MVYLSQMWFLVAPVSALRLVILVDLMSNACLYELYLGGTEVLPVDLNIISIIICCYPWYYPTPSFHASIWSCVVAGVNIERGLL